MTAKEMFEELGYKKDLVTHVIRYIKPCTNCLRDREIMFYDRSFPRSYSATNEYNVPALITIEEHRAIHQQMKELGWIEELKQ